MWAEKLFEFGNIGRKIQFVCWWKIVSGDLGEESYEIIKFRASKGLEKTKEELYEKISLKMNKRKAVYLEVSLNVKIKAKNTCINDNLCV